MIFRDSKPNILMCGTVLLLLTACAQAPNYAPVTSVNQTFKPDNGDFGQNTLLKPRDTQQIQKNPEKGMDRQPQKNLGRQKAFINQSSNIDSSPNKNNHFQENLPEIKLAVNQATTSSKTLTDQNQGFYKPASLPPTAYLQNKEINVKNQISKPQQKPTVAPQAITKTPKNKPVNSGTKIIPRQDRPQDNTKIPVKKRSISKNNKEKTSIVSIDNKKMLKLNFDWPIRGKISRSFSQTDNKGIDIVGKTGQDVRAAESGKAVYCGHGLAGFGNLAIIKHNETFLSAYANNRELFIKEGQHVEKGQTIGQIGSTKLTKSSLHFEIRKNGQPINPLSLLPKH